MLSAVTIMFRPGHLLCFMVPATAINEVREIYAACVAYQLDSTTMNTTPAPTWVNTPEIRGTLTIIYSCVATILVCSYITPHLDMPIRRGSWLWLISKGRWVLISLLAPEFMIFVSASQFMKAKRLQRELRNILSRTSHKSEDNSRAAAEAFPSEVRLFPRCYQYLVLY